MAVSYIALSSSSVNRTTVFFLSLLPPASESELHQLSGGRKPRARRFLTDPLAWTFVRPLLGVHAARSLSLLFEFESTGSYSEPDISCSSEASGDGGAFLLVGGPLNFLPSSVVTPTRAFLGVTFLTVARADFVGVMSLASGLSVALVFLRRPRLFIFDIRRVVNNAYDLLYFFLGCILFSQV